MVPLLFCFVLFSFLPQDFHTGHSHGDGIDDGRGGGQREKTKKENSLNFLLKSARMNPQKEKKDLGSVRAGVAFEAGYQGQSVIRARVDLYSRIRRQAAGHGLKMMIDD